MTKDMTNPIINGDEVQVGQVWETTCGNSAFIAQSGIDDEDGSPIIGGVIYGNRTCYCHIDADILVKLIGHVTPIAEPTQGGWIEWHGGSGGCPVISEKLDAIKFKDGRVSSLFGGELFSWDNVAAYRVVTPHAEQPVTPRKLMLSAEYVHKETMTLAANMMDGGSELSLSGANEAAAWMMFELIKSIEANPELMERVR